MDQSLKARLIGATVLVALAVILIPELLSGRKDIAEMPSPSGTPDSRTFTIELGGTGNRPATPSQPGPAPAGTAGTSTASTGPVSAAGAQAGTQSTAAKAATPKPAEVHPKAEIAPTSPAEAAVETQQPPRPTGPSAAAPTAASGGTGWLVQVGAFSNVNTARKMVQDLGKDGFSAQIAPISRGGRTLHRVRVGPVADRAEAQRLASRLEARGLPATVVAGD